MDNKYTRLANKVRHVMHLPGDNPFSLEELELIFSTLHKASTLMGDTIVYMGIEARKKQILDCIRDNPGIFNKRISEKLCLARSRIDTLTRELFRDGVIRRELDSLRRNLWYLTDAKPIQK